MDLLPRIAQGGFRFLDLPQEIRRMIYREALRIPIEAGAVHHHDCRRMKLRSAILRTCKICHVEAVPFLYGGLLFNTKESHHQLQFKHKFFHQVGLSNASCVRLATNRFYFRVEDIEKFAKTSSSLRIADRLQDPSWLEGCTDLLRLFRGLWYLEVYQDDAFEDDEYLRELGQELLRDHPTLTRMVKVLKYRAFSPVVTIAFVSNNDMFSDGSKHDKYVVIYDKSASKMSNGSVANNASLEDYHHGHNGAILYHFNAVSEAYAEWHTLLDGVQRRIAGSIVMEQDLFGGKWYARPTAGGMKDIKNISTKETSKMEQM